MSKYQNINTHIYCFFFWTPTFGVLGHHRKARFLGVPAEKGGFQAFGLCFVQSIHGTQRMVHSAVHTSKLPCNVKMFAGKVLMQKWRRSSSTLPLASSHNTRRTFLTSDSYQIQIYQPQHMGKTKESTGKRDAGHCRAPPELRTNISPGLWCLGRLKSAPPRPCSCNGGIKVFSRLMSTLD